MRKLLLAILVVTLTVALPQSVGAEDDEVAQLKAENDKLKAENVELKKKAGTLKSDCDKLAVQNRTAQDCLAQAVDVAAKLRKQVEELTKQVHELSAQAASTSKPAVVKGPAAATQSAGPTATTAKAE